MPAAQNARALSDISQADERRLAAEEELSILANRLASSQAALEQHRAALRAMDEKTAVGHAFNIANARPVAQSEFVEALAKTCRKPAKFVRIPRDYLLRAGGHPMGPKMYFGVYLDMPPITQVTAKAQRVLKFKPTDFATGLQETYKWYLRHKGAKQDYSFEDMLLTHAPVLPPPKA